ncbi:PA4780 family RIO1-like protein kinase [Denitrificimonas sp. JX-1]|uniref:non-specific serine/threonine protein kinase n=1 Tax=Denitrificimonas halotolerans TaxID=3098930 RepID=A0ABU5GRT9_9GAMM|nr:PA4780 family RIO1-like protein kinase [Denitrificimonas sp. JX-1]MDY7219584.1 PA4780 family RIO1-like protein kinase [Denitrificimonas sp. JX-1]
MKTPARLIPLIKDGLIDEVLRPLMNGKEAAVYVVRCGDEIRCAKVYKDMDKRSFKKASLYREGRKSGNSRRARAMEKGSKFGREQAEEAWQNAEVDALYRLATAKVRVPQPYGCFDGVLLMDLVTLPDGQVAPRLNDVSLEPSEARRDHAILMESIKRMLSIGLIHGDLSEFNVLVDEQGPVIIDLPQAVDAAANNNAFFMLNRDINNITQYYAQYAPELLQTQYAPEMWSLYKEGNLTADTPLTGKFLEPDTEADVDSVMAEIQAVLNEERDRVARANAEDFESYS